MEKSQSFLTRPSQKIYDYSRRINLVNLINYCCVLISTGNLILLTLWNKKGWKTGAIIFWGFSIIFIIDYFRKNRKGSSAINMKVVSKRSTVSDDPTPSHKNYITGMTNEGKTIELSAYDDAYDKLKEGTAYNLVIDSDNTIVNTLEELSRSNNDLDKEFRSKQTITITLVVILCITSILIMGKLLFPK